MVTIKCYDYIHPINNSKCTYTAHFLSHLNIDQHLPEIVKNTKSEIIVKTVTVGDKEEVSVADLRKDLQSWHLDMLRSQVILGFLGS